METIHNITNNHPIITIIIIGFIVGIAVIIVALKNAKELVNNDKELVNNDK
jgi:hypothetical protein